MKEFKSIAVALIAGICIIISVAIGVNGLITFRKSSAEGGLTATGSASQNFTSDLIVWGGSFPATAPTTKEAYVTLKKYEEAIHNYLQENGVKEEEIVFSSIDITQNYHNEYFENGNIKDTIYDGYTLTQRVKIESTEVDKIEKISRDITKLIDAGVEFYSNPPEYYYTKLDELKLEMITQATQNARKRAELVADNAKSSLGELITANLGVFQIVAQNSSDTYSDVGAFDTSSKDKSVFVTVRLYYKLK